MKRREFFCVLGGMVAGIWPGRRTILAVMAALVLLPNEVSDAGWLSDVFKGSSKHGKSPKHITSPKRATLAKPAASLNHHPENLAALGPVTLNTSPLKPGPTPANPSKSRIVPSLD